MFAGACPSPPPDRGGVELHQLEPTVAVRGLHHRVLHPDALEPDHAVDPTALDLPFSLQLESEFDEERGRSLEVVDHDAHVLQALDRHALDGSGVTGPSCSVSRLPIGWWERAAHRSFGMLVHAGFEVRGTFPNTWRKS